MQWNFEATNKGGFDASSLKKWLNEAVFKSIPATLQKMITEKPSVGKIWVTFEMEVFGETIHSVDPGSLTQYSLFTDASKRIKH